MSVNFAQKVISHVNFTQSLTAKVNDTLQFSSQSLPEGISIVFGLMAVLITMTNIMICALVYFYKQLQTFTNGIIVSLAVSDLIFGAIWLPTYIFFPFSNADGYLNCLVLLSNISNLCSLTLERAIAVTKPFEYRYIIGKYFTLMITLSWVIPLVVTLVPLAWDTEDPEELDLTTHNIYLIFLLFFILIPYVFIISVYSIILCYVHKRQRRLCRISSGSDESACYRAEFKVFRLFFLITLLYSVAWIPVLYLTICTVLHRADLIIPEIFIFNVFGLCFNSLANGFLYAFLKPDFKKVLKKIFVNCSYKGKQYDMTIGSNGKTGTVLTSLRHMRSTSGRKGTSLCGSPVPLEKDSPVFQNWKHAKTSTVINKITVV